jgi:hypothetical protein
MDERRDIGGISVAVPDKSPALLGLVHCRFECPARGGGITEFSGWSHLDSDATLSAGYPKEARMGDIPFSVEIQKIT